MRNALKSIKRMRLMSALIVIQLAISLAMVNSTASIVEGYMNKIDGFSRLMGKEKTYLLKVNDPGLASLAGRQIDAQASGESHDMNKLDIRVLQMFYHNKDFNENLKELQNKGLIKNIFYNFPLYSMIDYENLVNEEYKEKPKDKEIIKNPGFYPNEEFTSIIVNYNFINHYNLSIYEGRGFTEEDFNIDYKKDPIPVILGKGYNEKVKIGDILEGKDMTYVYLLNESNGDNIEKHINKNGRAEMVEVDLKFKVIGFYDDNEIPAMFSHQNIVQYVRYSNTYSIIPCIKGFPGLNEMGIGIDLGCYIEVKSKTDLEKVKTELEPQLKEKGLELQILDLEEESDKINEVMARDVLTSGILGVILMLLSIIGITSVLLGELNERKKEFGIRIACGATIKTLCKEMILEIILMIATAAILSLLMILREESAITINVILINIGLMGIASMIISILPIMRLRKMNPVDLVRGK